MSRKKAVKVLELVSEKLQTALAKARNEQREIMEDPTLSDGRGWRKIAIQMKSPIPGLEASLEIIKSSMQEITVI